MPAPSKARDSTKDETSSSATPQILTRSMVALLIQDLDAGDVLECYALVRKAPLQVGSTLNQTLVVSKMALGLRYLPPSNSKSKQPPKPKLELTLEYGPQRLDNQRESTPLVQHPDATSSSSSSSGGGGGTSSGTSGSGEESLSVTWENQGRIYYTTSISTSHYNGAYYMASLTGAVLESILYKAVEYPTLHGHRRYQPFSVYQRPAPPQQSSSSSSSQQQSPSSSSSSSSQQEAPPRLLLKSSSATDFVREMFHHMAQLGVELQPILAPPMYQLRLWVSAPVEKLQVGVATPAALFYSHLYQCLHSLVTGDYSHYTPTAAPSISTMPSTSPMQSHVPTWTPSVHPRDNGTTSSSTSSMVPTLFNVTPVYIDDDDNWFNNSTLHNATSKGMPHNNKNNDTSTMPSTLNMTNTTTKTKGTSASKKNAPTKKTAVTTNATTPRAQNSTKKNETKANRRQLVSQPWNWYFRRAKVETKGSIVPSNVPSTIPSISPQQQQPLPQPLPETPSSSVDTAQKAAEEAKEAAQVAHNAANQKDEHATATAAEKAATAAQKAADATYSAANQQAREGLLSGDGDIMANILASTCFSNPQYEITKRAIEPVTIPNSDNGTFANATNRTNTPGTTTPPTTLAYLYIDGSFYYRLKMTSPYIDLVRVEFDLPQASTVGGGNLLLGNGSGGDILDWALAVVIVVAVVVGVTITLQAIGFRIYRPLLKWQRRFFHPQKYLNNMDHDDSERGDFEHHDFDFDDDDESSVDDAIPTSMGGRRTSWMMRGHGSPTSRTLQSQIPFASQGNGGGNHHHHPIMLDEFVDESISHEHNDSNNMKVVEMTPLNGADHMGRNTSHHTHNGRRRLSSSANRTTMSFEERLRETEVPTRFARDPDLVDLPHLKSKSKVAIPASLVVHGRGTSFGVDDDDLSVDDDDDVIE